ncbi:MAG: Crp/Fnr family transcriptional regulator [Rhodoferax sp.]|nr:Crp/Fnr family transcriptional regulator [Rhodoferax sp.]
MSIYTYQLLKGVGLSEQRVLSVLPKIKVDSLNAGQIICHKGSQPEAWHHIVSGLVGAGIPQENGVITPINIFGPGTWFGEVAILNHRPLMVDCVCLTPVRILKMPLEQAVDAFENDADFSRHVARLIAWRTQQQSEMLILMRLGSPQLRVVLGLALFAEALHSSNSHLPTNELDDSLDIPVKQSALAAMCGVSRGIFSECVQHLAAAGWVRLSYATLALSKILVWHNFSRRHRQNRHNNAKPVMPEILHMFEEAAVSSPSLRGTQ